MKEYLKKKNQSYEQISLTLNLRNTDLSIVDENEQKNHRVHIIVTSTDIKMFG